MDISEVYYFAYLKLKDMWEEAADDYFQNPSDANLKRKQQLEAKISFVSRLE